MRMAGETEAACGFPIFLKGGYARHYRELLGRTVCMVPASKHSSWRRRARKGEKCVEYDVTTGSGWELLGKEGPGSARGSRGQPVREPPSGCATSVWSEARTAARAAFHFSTDSGIALALECSLVPVNVSLPEVGQGAPTRLPLLDGQMGMLGLEPTLRLGLRERQEKPTCYYT